MFDGMVTGVIVEVGVCISGISSMDLDARLVKLLCESQF
jgi:hypothetical protein